MEEMASIRLQIMSGHWRPTEKFNFKDVQFAEVVNFHAVIEKFRFLPRWLPTTPLNQSAAFLQTYLELLKRHAATADSDKWIMYVQFRIVLMSF